MRCFLRSVCCSFILASGLVWAQPVGQNPAGPQEKPSSDSVATTIRTPPLPPVDFRQLLALKPEEQQRVLASKPEPKRRLLQSKLREYQGLSPEERDARLRLVQLHLYLPALMKLAPTNRAVILRSIPSEDQKLIEERLEQWDLLPKHLQKEALDHEMALHYFLRFESGGPVETRITTAPVGYRQLDGKLEQWRALKPEKRERMYQHFQRFFELPPKQKEKILDTLEELSEAERQQMENSLQTFERLPPEQRKACIESFRQFANMTKAEQDQFLKNAERWKAMSARERETWRNLTTLFPSPGPPMPPGAPGFRPAPALPGEKAPVGSNTNKLPALPGDVRQP